MSPQKNCGSNCCVVGCMSRGYSVPEICYYRFPGQPWERERRQRWIVAVRRQRYVNKGDKLWEPSKTSLICSLHFENGKKSNDPRQNAYNPTIFPHVYKRKTPSNTGRAERLAKRRENLDKSAEAVLDSSRTLSTMPGCSAINCSNSSEKGFSMKCFPRDPDRRRQWQIKNRRDGWTPTNNSYLCEIHFATDMWEKPRDGLRKLKYNAVPTIFPFSALKNSRKHPNRRKEDVPILFLSKETENTVTETWNHVENNGCSNVPMEAIAITESEVKIEYDEDSWRNDLLLEKPDLQISVEPKLETGIFDLFKQLWTGEYAPILPSRAWAIHFIESVDGNVICLSRLVKIGDNTVSGKEILISNSSINLYVYSKLYEIGNLNLTSFLISIENFQSILESFENLKLNSMMDDSNNSTSIKVEPDV